MVRVYITIKAAEYAQLYGVTTRVARARIIKMAGAAKVGSRWQVPILATEYARRKGIRPESARRRKGAIRASSPTAASRIADDKLRNEIVNKLIRFAAQRKYHNPNTIAERIDHASTAQLLKLRHLNARQWLTATTASVVGDTADWEGDDYETILYYH